MLPYLDEHPPTHILVAGILRALGWKGVESRRGLPPAPTSIDELPSKIPGLGIGGDVHAGLGTAAILDFEELKARHHG